MKIGLTKTLETIVERLLYATKNPKMVQELKSMKKSVFAYRVISVIAVLFELHFRMVSLRNTLLNTYILCA